MMRSRTYMAIPPGATIREQLQERGMSQREFALRMELSEKHISKLINGDVQLTHDVAIRLEMVLGLPAHFWNNLEAIYREKYALAKAENEMDEDIGIARKFPYNEMAKHRWVPDAGRIEEKVFNLRRFFEVVRLGCLDNDSLAPGIACRRQSATQKADFALLAWAQRAKIEARERQTTAIDLKTLEERLPEIREMTKSDPDEFCEKLVSLFANCGIALVFLPHIGGSFLHGATFCDAQKIVMGLTVRGKDADKFWFSLFHEVGHIIKGHIWEDGGTDNEIEADLFAREMLIPSKEYEKFLRNGDFSKRSILSFAKKINLMPGIIVGRLQKEGYIKYSWHNDLKMQYEIS